MECPHCRRHVSPFSPALNRFGKRRQCPYCAQPVRLVVGLVPALVGFVPAVLVSWVMKPWLGLLATLLAVAGLMLVSFRLRAGCSSRRCVAPAMRETGSNGRGHARGRHP